MSETDNGNADLLLPFLQSAGALVLNLLGAQLHHKAAARFVAPQSAQGQGENPRQSYATLHIVLSRCGTLLLECLL